MSEQDLEQLMLFQEDSPANLFPWLESKKVKGTTVTYGRKCLELSESLRRVGSSVRTYLESCVLPLPTLSRTWSVKDITSQCLILKLRLSVRRTEEKGSSSSALWKTPVTADSGNREFYRNSRGEPNLSGQVKVSPTGLPPTPTEGKLWPTACAMDAATERMKSSQQKEGSMHSVTLPDAVRMWPTPTTRDYKDGSVESCKNVPVNGLLGRAVHLFPTPNTSDAKWCGPAGSKSAEDKKTNYLRAAVLTKQQEGQLNPDWVEWLQGFPVGWTSLTSQE